MIDWQQQWALFAPKFINGKAHIGLPNGSEIQLLPGPGFGDFSHPTTQLMISLMAEYVPGRAVFDIGCGSGILSVAAAKMGAKKVYACDIDEQAIAHTKENGQLNGVKIDFDLPKVKPIVLMNMISSEQHMAWKTNACPFDTLICSGILLADADNYMEFAKANSWELIHQEESQGWLGMVFKETQS